MILAEKETSCSIAGPVGLLEARLCAPSSGGVLAPLNGVAIICHPHPQQGGTMENKVVTTLMRTYRDLGIATVRFNFRGVGASEGQFAHAQGELDDLLAVIAWVIQHFPAQRLLLAGFSFGSSIAARASHLCLQVEHLTLVAPPVERYVYDQAGTFSMPVCVIQGDLDELVNAAGVYAWVESLKSPVQLIRYAQAGHFFHGLLTRLKTDLSEYLCNHFTELKPL
jgi:uncharacterized protein